MLTRPRLEKAALAYLERFASSSANLRRVLERRIRRAAQRGELEEIGTAQRWADEIIAVLLSKGLLNDALYAELKAGSLHRRGLGRRRIAAVLADKGLAQDQVLLALGQVMVEERADNADALDRSAAWTLARKRRLGPFRPAEARLENRQRDMAVLGRAGFTYEVARAVVDGDETEPERA